MRKIVFKSQDEHSGTLQQDEKYINNFYLAKCDIQKSAISIVDYITPCLPGLLFFLHYKPCLFED